MRKYVMTALLMFLATTALAAQFPNYFYVALNTTTGKCQMMTHKPTGHFKMMGRYTSRSAAMSAMHQMSECK